MSHSHHHHDHPNRTKAVDQNRVSISIALIITSAFVIVEAIGGWISNSLALLSDAGHMLSDAASLGLSLFAMWIATRPPSSEKTFGYYRFEILAALFNGLALLGVSIYIYIEAYHRFWQPPEVASRMMLFIAFIGLIANLVCAWILTRGDVKENLNLRSAFLHVIGDILGSLGAIGAGLFIYYFNWYIADPIISVIIATLVFLSGLRVTGESLHILMEGTPRDINVTLLVETLKKIPGVKNVHELHIWTITSGFHSLSCHLVIPYGEDDQEILENAKKVIQQQFGITHTTIEIERPS
ncbi:cation diffusion facilitator family transporter [Microaerobacter geothermalis]|uniref:cation diffusion facilitator family transporter n=1 Tax=Microaerobacter geothermalis TaxID=674972 RepID=UPI001F465AC8|nr:cation diffusion facilitator family transporter [Microaerobacter geothermalis]MCF6093690.1 cation diffusion facilitator family transporter [Microaerobacter geothermalis]